MEKWIHRIKRMYRNMPDKKIYLEFITAALTIPVLITVLLNNINSLKKEPALSPTPTQIPISSAPNVSPKRSPPSPPPTAPVVTPPPDQNPSPSPDCVPQVGGLEITSPDDREQVNRDPVCLDIARKTSGYCPIVWSYRINGSAWSDYTDKSICLYGLSAGEKHVDVRARSIVSADETLVQRVFTVVGPTPTPPPIPVSTSSGTLK